MSDSPMWKRGKRSRSYNWTRQPCWARSVETVLPAGPPPMTTTSVVVQPFGLLMGSTFLRIESSLPGAGSIFVRQPGRAQQHGQLLELARRQVPELADV